MAIPGAYVYPPAPPPLPGSVVETLPPAAVLPPVVPGQSGRRGRRFGEMGPGSSELDRLLGGDGRRATGGVGAPGAPAGAGGGFDDDDDGMGGFDDGDDDGFGRRQVAGVAPDATIQPFPFGRDGRAVPQGSEGYKSLLFGGGIGRNAAGGSARAAASGGAGISTGAGTGGWLTRLHRRLDD